VFDEFARFASKMPESLIFGVGQNDAKAKPRHNYHNLSPYDCGFKVEEHTISIENSFQPFSKSICAATESSCHSYMHQSEGGVNDLYLPPRCNIKDRDTHICSQQIK
jgi:hypothetical protein